MNIQIIVLLFCFSQLLTIQCIKCGNSTYDDDDDSCVCCSTSGVCLTLLKCPLKPHSDFDILVTTLIIIGAFAIGIPLVLVILDFLIMGRPFGCKMSCCECVAQYICCCCCFNKNTRKNIDSQGQSYQKILTH